MPTMLSENDRMWLAGWLEGEGWFGLSLRSGTLCIHACSTDIDVIMRVKTLLGAKVVTKKKPNTALTRRQAYNCRVLGSTAATIMQQILPEMGERRAGRIRELLTHHDNR